MATYQGYDSGDPKPEGSRPLWDQVNALRYASAQERNGGLSGFYDNVLKGIQSKNQRLGRASMPASFWTQLAPNWVASGPEYRYRTPEERGAYVVNQPAQGPTTTIGAPGGAVSNPTIPAQGPSTTIGAPSGAPAAPSTKPWEAGREQPARSYSPKERNSYIVDPTGGVPTSKWSAGRQQPAQSYTPEQRGSRVISEGLGSGLEPVGSGSGSIVGNPQPTNMGPPTNTGAGTIVPQGTPGAIAGSPPPVNYGTSAVPAQTQAPQVQMGPPPMGTMGFVPSPVAEAPTGGAEGAYDPSGGRQGMTPGDPNYGLLFGYQPGSAGVGRPGSRGGY